MRSIINKLFSMIRGEVSPNEFYYTRLKTIDGLALRTDLKQLAAYMQERDCSTSAIAVGASVENKNYNTIEVVVIADNFESFPSLEDNVRDFVDLRNEDMSNKKSSREEYPYLSKIQMRAYKSNEYDSLDVVLEKYRNKKRKYCILYRNNKLL